MSVEEILRTLVIVLVVVFAVIGLAAVVLVGFVALRRRYLLPGALAVLGAALYGASPIDVLPEALLGPLGYVDDAGILTAAVAFLVHLQRRHQSAKAGKDDTVTVTQLPDGPGRRR